MMCNMLCKPEHLCSTTKINLKWHMSPLTNLYNLYCASCNVKIAEGHIAISINCSALIFFHQYGQKSLWGYWEYPQNHSDCLKLHLLKHKSLVL